VWQGFRVSVIIPALNEAESLPHVLPLIPEQVDEVLLVDGASTDGTIEVAKAIRPDIRIVFQESRGKGAALRAGFEAATGDIVVHLDADGSTDPREIPAFVETLLAGADYAKGTRFGKGGLSDDITPLRRLGNWSFVAIANVLYGSSFTDITYGYNAVWRRHHALLAPEIDGWAHEIIANIRAHRRGLKVVEVASIEAPRVAGEAKLQTFSAGWTIFKAIVGERFQPLPPVGGQARVAVEQRGFTGPVERPAELATSSMVAVPIVADTTVSAISMRGYEDLVPVLVEAD